MMKIRTAAVMAALVLGAAAFADEAATDVQNDAFSIRLPAGFAAFTTQAQTAKAAEGTIETTNWVSKAPTGEAVVVTVSKMPEDSRPGEADDQHAGDAPEEPERDAGERGEGRGRRAGDESDVP